MSYSKQLETIDEYTYKMPSGAYFDSDEILRDRDGEALPDGLYEDEAGNLISYEGNFAKMLFD